MLAPAEARPRPTLVAERAVLVMRHGIRAPLPGEVPEATRTRGDWPRWPVAPSRITPHGERALALVAQADRRLLAWRGLLTSAGCPAPGMIRIHTNSSDRTIASGEAYARGFAPGCAVTVEHRPLGEADPIFEPLRARATRFDAGAAIASIERETGGMAALVRRHRAELALLDRVLGCPASPQGCVPAGPPSLQPGEGGHDIILSGPIRATSGVAQVLLLEYLEGMSRADVGWGRADAETLRRIGALHAALFTVFTRPTYMAAHQSAVLGREVLRSLGDAGPRLTVLMGHDTNVTALAAALRVDLKAPGYAANDVPPGGALQIERLRDTRSGASFVRVSYRTQPPAGLRAGTQATSLVPLRIPGCGEILCAAETFRSLLQKRLAPLDGEGETSALSASSQQIAAKGSAPN
ncbi:histidine-type phosphatase [Sphingomonas psychrotolerans]|uniref:Histidine-type phosphatase n=1 Tax=Sphingomonas psychrotolerans TaxID=1327635 RepID=A0ABU3N3L0_9SPHN|nr:histidine-type phosphatase [Sphingomonas psychrotolerans]MDT8758086.1 histidine-type phosphatase [Sphingomonas psychrotolerans]